MSNLHYTARRPVRLRMLGGAAACLVSIGPLSAQPVVDWHSIDGGSTRSSFGSLELVGVAGQADAGPTLSGGTLVLLGGFLSAECEAGPVGCNASDLSEPFGVLDLLDINVFIDGIVGNDPVADLDGNGILDLSDIGLFTSSFLGGCP